MARRSDVGNWVLVLALALGPAAGNGFARFAYGLILPAMQEDLHWSYTEAGWINTANALGYLLGAVMTLQAITKWRLEQLYILGMIATSLSVIFLSVTRDFWLLSVWRAVGGISAAPVFIAGGAMVSTLFKGNASRNALAIALYFGGVGFGMFISGTFLPMLFQQWGVVAWPTAWLLLGLLCGAVTLVAWCVIRISRFSPNLQNSAARINLPISAMTPLLLSYTLFAVGHIAYLTFLVAWVHEQSVSSTEVALIWSVLSIGSIVSPFLWRPILARSFGGAALALCCATTALGTVLPAVSSASSVVIGSTILVGVSFLVAPTAVTSFSRKNLAEEQWGPAVALFTILFAVGQIIGPVAAGFIADYAGGLDTALLCSGSILLISSAIAVVQKRLLPVQSTQHAPAD